MLQVAPNDVKDAVSEGEAVADSTFIAHRSDQNVLAFGVGAGDHATNILQVVLLHKDNEEHLVHGDEPVRLVNVLEAMALQEHLYVLSTLRYFALKTLLRGQEHHVVVLHIGEESG